MKSVTALAVGFLALLVPATALGQIKPAFWLGVSGGLNRYSMSDVNDDISYMNASAGLSMDEISSGFAVGIEAGLKVTPTISLGAGYERLAASTEYSDIGGSLEYDFPANAFYGAVQYSFPSASAFHLGLSGAIGTISAAGKLTLTIYGAGAASEDVTGSGVLLEGRVVGDIHVTPRVVLSPSAGYRLANIKEFEIDDETVYSMDGSKMSLDYSGLTMRLGLKFILN